MRRRRTASARTRAAISAARTRTPAPALQDRSASAGTASSRRWTSTPQPGGTNAQRPSEGAVGGFRRLGSEARAGEGAVLLYGDPAQPTIRAPAGENIRLLE